MIKFACDLTYNKEILLNASMEILLLFAIILFCIGIFKKRNKDILKIAGLMIVVFIAILSNNAYNYFFAIVIVATLITELDFLERIVAILRNVSDKYWDTVHIDTATSTEKAEKVEAEADAEVEAKTNVENELNAKCEV